jgi:predicted acylesterase/phospholipase RssA
MFYAGFMEELAKHSHQVQLNNVSGTSAGAVIGALKVVGKEHMMANILLNAFKDTGLKICW